VISGCTSASWISRRDRIAAAHHDGARYLPPTRAIP
jgi:hypothetical protein